MASDGKALEVASGCGAAIDFSHSGLEGGSPHEQRVVRKREESMGRVCWPRGVEGPSNLGVLRRSLVSAKQATMAGRPRIDAYEA